MQVKNLLNSRCSTVKGYYSDNCDKKDLSKTNFSNLNFNEDDDFFDCDCSPIRKNRKEGTEKV